MKHLNRANEISHNIQIAVDAKYHMVVAVDVTSEAVDYQQFYPMVTQTKENLGVDTLTVLAGRSYFSVQQLDKAEKDNIVLIVAKPDRNDAPDPDYASTYFVYNEQNDTSFARKTRNCQEKINAKIQNPTLNMAASTSVKTVRSEINALLTKRADTFAEAPADNAFLRIYENRSLYKKRKVLVEYVFGTVKTSFGFRYPTVHRTGMVKTNTCLFFLMYNLK